ncbi:grasp-with-spasm system ATP-grasp peptide maturase [Flavobacterium sp.]|uniref:grasp-with-spasm system ATP-grasp peptide maturase n=1 Tax=Flavobacterium sp. TaxID=239 RepID=UPI00374FE2C6
MILILSEEDDSSTTDVLQWLNTLNKKWFRINETDKIELEFIGDDIVFKMNSSSFLLSEIKSFWYRRGYFNVTGFEKTHIEQIDMLRNEEIRTFIQFLHYRLYKIKHLNSFKNSSVNKLIIGDIARKFKLKTPNDFIISNKTYLSKILDNSRERYITKVISGNCMQDFDDFTIINFTSLIDLKKVNSENFFPSLAQNYIEKKYELRIFYLERNFYSMAIFSQNDDQTNIDFRNYNKTRPNRCVPFKLPNEVEEKITALMEKIDLNCGSIDMIVTLENEYVFLEVNPVGQFGMVSFPCNYNLEKKIAEYL